MWVGSESQLCPALASLREESQENLGFSGHWRSQKSLAEDEAWELELSFGADLNLYKAEKAP